MKPRAITLTGMALADQVQREADELLKQQKAAAEKAETHRRVFEKMDAFKDLPAYWANQLKTSVNELLGRQFMDAPTILAELEKDKPIESAHNLKMKLETFRRNKVADRSPSAPEIPMERKSFPPATAEFHVGAVKTPTGLRTNPLLPDGSVQRGASGLNKTVRTLLGDLLEEKPRDEKK